MYFNLLFAVASITGSTTATVTPPPPPIVTVETVTVTPPPPLIVKVETVTVTQHLDNPTVVVEDVETVTFDTGDGKATTDRATYNKLLETAALGETDEEYDARLLRQLCEIKPWFCE